MPTLQEDILYYSNFLINAFAGDDVTLDYSIESLKEIDRFFDLHSKDGEVIPGGRLSENLGAIFFALGSYIGQTIAKNAPGSTWRTDDNDPEGELNAQFILPNGTIMYPMQKVVKRFQNGAQDSIYAYGFAAVNEYANRDWSKK
jgi:hypothetical protein